MVIAVCLADSINHWLDRYYSAVVRIADSRFSHVFPDTCRTGFVWGYLCTASGSCFRLCHHRPSFVHSFGRWPYLGRLLANAYLSASSQPRSSGQLCHLRLLPSSFRIKPKIFEPMAKLFPTSTLVWPTASSMSNHSRI